MYRIYQIIVWIVLSISLSHSLSVKQLGFSEDISTNLIWYGNWDLSEKPIEDSIPNRVINSLRHLESSDFAGLSFLGRRDVHLKEPNHFHFVASQIPINKPFLESILFHMMSNQSILSEENTLNIFIPHENVLTVENYCQESCSYHTPMKFDNKISFGVFITHPMNCKSTNICMRSPLSHELYPSVGDAIFGWMLYEIRKILDNPLSSDQLHLSNMPTSTTHDIMSHDEKSLLLQSSSSVIDSTSLDNGSDSQLLSQPRINNNAYLSTNQNIHLPNNINNNIIINNNNHARGSSSLLRAASTPFPGSTPVNSPSDFPGSAPVSFPSVQATTAAPSMPTSVPASGPSVQNGPIGRDSAAPTPYPTGTISPTGVEGSCFQNIPEASEFPEPITVDEVSGTKFTLTGQSTVTIRYYYDYDYPGLCSGCVVQLYLGVKGIATTSCQVFIEGSPGGYTLSYRVTLDPGCYEVFFTDQYGSSCFYYGAVTSGTTTLGAIFVAEEPSSTPTTAPTETPSYVPSAAPSSTLSPTHTRSPTGVEGSCFQNIPEASELSSLITIGELSGTKFTLTGSSTVTIQYSYAKTSLDFCPGCVVQLYLGVKGIATNTCQNTYGSAVATFTFSYTITLDPGCYEVFFAEQLGYNCYYFGAVTSGTTTLGAIYVPGQPSLKPTVSPTIPPTLLPSTSPTASPITAVPSLTPSASPTGTQGQCFSRVPSGYTMTVNGVTGNLFTLATPQNITFVHSWLASNNCPSVCAIQYFAGVEGYKVQTCKILRNSVASILEYNLVIPLTRYGCNYIYHNSTSISTRLQSCVLPKKGSGEIIGAVYVGRSDPTITPTSFSPTSRPRRGPTPKPTSNPSSVPTVGPSMSPMTAAPTASPSLRPSGGPSAVPTARPTVTPTVTPTSAPNQHLALCDFYQSTRGSLIDHGWECGSNGYPASQICGGGWEGVTCTSNTDILSLTLSGLRLKGPIPTSFGTLSLLTNLTLSDNYISGSIPSQMGLATNLEALLLDDNGLVGKIPSALGRLRKLKRLHLNGNQLTGPIPSQIFNTTNALSVLRVFDNALSGSLPTSLVYGSNVIELSIHKNSIVGRIPTGLGSLTGLSTISFNDNLLAGTIPSQIGLISGFLTALLLQGNSLKGPIPTAIGNLKYLQKLTLYDNDLSGNLPTQIGFLTGLIEVDLGANSLNGTIPDQLSSLTQITSLSLNDNSLSGCVANIGLISSSLAELFLSENSLSCGLPSSISSLKSLTVLSLSRNRLQYSLPIELGQLSSLQALHLSNNRFTNAIPTSLEQLTGLTFLDLRINSLNGTLPDILSNLDGLRFLSVEKNHITGTLPASLSKLSKLQYLDVSYNRLDGLLPTTIGNFPELEDIFLGTNTFSGKIPHQISGLSKLVTLSLSSNVLDNVIPTSISELSLLTYLNINQNYLNGSIPSEVGQLSQLEYLFLTSNSLTGILPSSLYSLSSLRTLSLSYNYIKGTVATAIANLRNLEQLYIKYNSLTGTIPSAICSLAPPLAGGSRGGGGELVDVGLLWNRFRCYEACSDGLSYGFSVDFTGAYPSCPTTTTTAAVAKLLLASASGDVEGASVGAGRDVEVGESVAGAGAGAAERKDLLAQLVDASAICEFVAATQWSTQISLCTSASGNPALSTVCTWTGVTCDSGKTSILKLSLSGKSLIGSLPTSISKLSTLTSLDLSVNSLKSNLPIAASLLKNLVDLNLNKNSFTSTIPAYLTTLTKLTSIQLKSNLFTGVIPTSLCALSKLGTKLALSPNPMIRCYSSCISTFTTTSALKDCIPVSGLCDVATALDPTGNLRNNWACNTAPTVTAICSKTGVTCDTSKSYVLKLALTGLKYTGTVSTSIGSIISLTALDLSANSLKGSLPVTLNKLTDVTEINFNSNSLIGSIPSLLSQLQKLSTLKLTNNGLTGAIPSELCQISKLTSMTIQKNSQLVCYPQCLLPDLKDLAASSIKGKNCSTLAYSTLTVPPVFYTKYATCDAGAYQWTNTDFCNFYLKNACPVATVGTYTDSSKPTPVCPPTCLSNFPSIYCQSYSWFALGCGVYNGKVKTDVQSLVSKCIAAFNVIRANSNIPKTAVTLNTQITLLTNATVSPEIRLLAQHKSSDPTAFAQDKATIISALSDATGLPTSVFTVTDIVFTLSSGTSTRRRFHSLATQKDSAVVQVNVATTAEEQGLNVNNVNVAIQQIKDTLRQATAVNSSTGSGSSTFTKQLKKNQKANINSQVFLTGGRNNYVKFLSTEIQVDVTDGGAGSIINIPVKKIKSFSDAEKTRVPTLQPSGQPTSVPSGEPSNQPTGQPSGQPTSQPTGQPSSQPTGQPSSQPSSHPTAPTRIPTRVPTNNPSVRPTFSPSQQPSSATQTAIVNSYGLEISTGGGGSLVLMEGYNKDVHNQPIHPHQESIQRSEVVVFGETEIAAFEAAIANITNVKPYQVNVTSVEIIPPSSVKLKFTITLQTNSGPDNSLATKQNLKFTTALNVSLSSGLLVKNIQSFAYEYGADGLVTVTVPPTALSNLGVLQQLKKSPRPTRQPAPVIGGTPSQKPTKDGKRNPKDGPSTKASAAPVTGKVKEIVRKGKN